MGEIIELSLTNTDEVALINTEDYEKVKHIPWYKDSNGYVSKSLYVREGEWKGLKLHRVIIDAPEGMAVDHKNLNKLDNTRGNLRLATSLENSRNKGISKNNTTGFKGVSERDGKFVAHIRINGILNHLGGYLTKEDAAKAYNVMAEKHFGEFAHLNDVNHEGFEIPEKTIPFSKYRGVWYHKEKDKWYAGLNHGGKQRHIGSYGSEIDAAKAYNVYAIQVLDDAAILNDVDHSHFELKPKRKQSSQYLGVSLDPRRNTWSALVKISGEHKFMGSFDNEHDAARMCNFWAIDLHGESAKLNIIREEHG